MSTNIHEHKSVEQNPQKPVKRKWPPVAFAAIVGYIAPTVNFILQQLIAAGMYLWRKVCGQRV